MFYEALRLQFEGYIKSEACSLPAGEKKPGKSLKNFSLVASPTHFVFFFLLFIGILKISFKGLYFLTPFPLFIDFIVVGDFALVFILLLSTLCCWWLYKNKTWVVTKVSALKRSRTRLLIWYSSISSPPLSFLSCMFLPDKQFLGSSQI